MASTLLDRTVPVAFALVSLLVLATRVDLGFERVRVGIPVPTAVRGERLSLDLPDLSRLADGPAALLIRLRGGPEASEIAVLFDGAVVARVPVGAGETVGVNATVYPATGARHRLELAGGREGWRLRQLEIANVHGFSKGPLSLAIVPAGRQPHQPIPPWALVLLALALLVWRPRWEWPEARGPRIVHRLAVSLALGLFVATLVSNRLSPYGIFLAPQTVLLALAALYAERLAPFARAAARHAPRLTRRAVPLLPHLAVLAFFLWAVGQFYGRDEGFTTFIMFGEEFAESRHPAIRELPIAVWPGTGYDGQFYAQLALDPLLRDEATVAALDTPGYRARRPLVPGIAYLAALGHPWFALQAYALLNVVCWVVLGWLLLRWLPPGPPRHAAAWTGCMLSGGLLASVVRALVDGPSMLVMALAVLAVERGRRGLAAWVLAVATLGRDTNLFGASILPDRFRPRELTALALRAAIVLAPIVLWIAYLWMRGIDPFETGSRNFAAPLAAFAERWGDVWAGIDPARPRTLALSGFTTMIALTVQAAVLLARPAWSEAWWRLGAAYLILLVVLGPSVWDGHPIAATRTLLPMTVAFNILLPRGRWFWPLWVVGNLHVAEGLLLLMPWVSGGHYFD